MAAATPTISAQKVRSRPSAGPLQSGNPHTPLSRSISGLYGSPGSSFRIDDENALIFEFGARCLRAGFAGESAPRCTIYYTPELWRRVGDYRHFEPGYVRRCAGKKWEEGYELWPLDLRRADLGLVGEKIEKLLRETENRFLLLDNRARRVVLVAPSDLPRPLLSVLLGRLFGTLQAGFVTVLPSAVMSVVGTGVRGALVVEIGWEECTVTAVEEYREVRAGRSVRGGKSVARAVKNMLERYLKEQFPDAAPSQEKIGLDLVEEVMTRMLWCDPSSDSRPNADTEITIPFPTSSFPPLSLQIPFHELAQPVETSLFGPTYASTSSTTTTSDDHDLPLPYLLYKTLLHLPLDLRSICLSHVTFTGGISQIPGLKSRILQDLHELIDQRGWDLIRSYAPRCNLHRPSPSENKKQNSHTDPALTEIRDSNLQRPPRNEQPPSTTEVKSPLPAYKRAHDTTPLDIKVSSFQLTSVTSAEPGQLRAIETLGAWAGASLVSNLRIRGVVEIERDRFLAHGLVGGAVKVGAGGATQEGAYGRGRQSLGPGIKGGGGGWNLGVWA